MRSRRSPWPRARGRTPASPPLRRPVRCRPVSLSAFAGAGHGRRRGPAACVSGRRRMVVSPAHAAANSNAGRSDDDARAGCGQANAETGVAASRATRRYFESRSNPAAGSVCDAIAAHRAPAPVPAVAAPPPPPPADHRAGHGGGSRRDAAARLRNTSPAGAAPCLAVISVTMVRPALSGFAGSTFANELRQDIEGDHVAQWHRLACQQRRSGILPRVGRVAPDRARIRQRWISAWPADGG